MSFHIGDRVTHHRDESVVLTVIGFTSRGKVVTESRNGVHVALYDPDQLRKVDDQ